MRTSKLGSSLTVPRDRPNGWRRRSVTRAVRRSMPAAPVYHRRGSIVSWPRMPGRRPGGSSPSVALERLFDRDSPLSYEERLEALIRAALPDQVPRLSFGDELARGGMG